MLLGVARLFAEAAVSAGGLVEIRKHVFRFTAGGGCLVSTGRAASAMRGTAAAGAGDAVRDRVVGGVLSFVKGQI